jgi:hypothetical protein
VSKRGERSRSARRRASRAAGKAVRDRERLATLAPGGSPTRPIEVATSAVVEARARATPCPQCDGELAVEEHAVAPDPTRSLRVVRARCRRCHVPRAIYFQLPAGPN